MQDIEAYLGNPILNNDKKGTLFLDDNVKANLNRICELSLTLFDAKSCRILAKFSPALIEIAQSGDTDNFIDDGINSLTRFINTEAVVQEKITANLFRIVSPISLTSEVSLGVIEFYTNTEQLIKTKKKLLLN